MIVQFYSLSYNRYLSTTLRAHGNHGDQLMVSALDSGSSSPGLSAGQVIVHIVFLDKTLYSHSASLHPGV